jgi:hypothetical protein
VAKGLSNLPIGPILIILVGIIVVLYVLKNKNFLKFTTAAPVGGNTATGPHVYQTVGSPASDAPEEKERCGGRSVDMGIPTALDSYEATAIIDYGPADQNCSCGNEFDIKMFGPGHHSGGDCCWWLFCINNDGNGSVTTGGEGPHPTTVKDSTQGVIKASIGSVGGKKIGIKGVTWLNSDGASRHVEGWVDVTGAGTSWEKVVEDDLTSWGNETTATVNEVPKSESQPGEGQIVMFRVDCDQANWVFGEVIEIVPGQRSDGSGTAPSTTTPPATTPPAEEEEEPEEEEPEEQEEEDSGGDDEDNGGDGDSPGTRSQDPTTQRINSCSGLTGETYRSCVNGAAARSDRRRRGNLARRPMYRAMLSAYNYPNPRLLRRRRFRIGNIG